MPAEFIISGGNTTIRMEWTKPTVEAQAIINAVAENLWVNELGDNEIVINPFEDATWQQKLNVAFEHSGEVLVNMANSFVSNRDQKIAREAAIKHDLEE